MIKKVITGVVVVLLGVLSVFAVKTSKTSDTTVKGTSPEFTSPYLIVNGVTEWYFSAPMKQGTTTVCSFPAPVGSSTIQYASWRVTGGANPNTLSLDIGTTTNTAGTSTSPLVTNQSIVAGSVGIGNGYLPANFLSSQSFNGQYLNFVLGTTTSLTQAYTGYCQAEFTQY